MLIRRGQRSTIARALLLVLVAVGGSGASGCARVASSETSPSGRQRATSSASKQTHGASCEAGRLNEQAATVPLADLSVMPERYENQIIRTHGVLVPLFEMEAISDGKRSVPVDWGVLNVKHCHWKKVSADGVLRRSSGRRKFVLHVSAVRDEPG